MLLNAARRLLAGAELRRSQNGGLGAATAASNRSRKSRLRHTQTGAEALQTKAIPTEPSWSSMRLARLPAAVAGACVRSARSHHPFRRHTTAWPCGGVVERDRPQDRRRAKTSSVFAGFGLFDSLAGQRLLHRTLRQACHTNRRPERPTTVSSWACSIRCEIVSRVGAARDGPAHPRAGRRDHGVWGAQPPISTVKIPRKSPKSPKSGAARTLLVSGVVRKNHNFLRLEA